MHLSKSTPIIFSLLNSDNNNSNSKHNIAGKVISDDDDCVYDSIT